MTGLLRKRESHIWDRAGDDWYVEEEWCSRRLFDVEPFEGFLWDPACGMGRIPELARAAGYECFGTDVVDRGYDRLDAVADFFTYSYSAGHIVSNPPFDRFREFAEHALRITPQKVALIWLVRTLPAARWLRDTPLKMIWFLTPRPSMPPGEVILRGEKPGGGKQDFCWLVWDRYHKGAPTVGWLHRDRDGGEAP